MEIDQDTSKSSETQGQSPDEASELWQNHQNQQLSQKSGSSMSPLLLGVFGILALAILFLGLWVVAFN